LQPVNKVSKIGVGHVKFVFPGKVRQERKSRLQIYNVGVSFEMDVFGSFPKTLSENRYLLVIVDYFTKWKLFRCKRWRKFFLGQVIIRHGVSLEVHTDQRKSFESKVFYDLTRFLGIRNTRTTALHPQSGRASTSNSN